MKTKIQLFFEKWSDNDYCLKAVKQDGNYLQYVYAFIKSNKVNL